MSEGNLGQFLQAAYRQLADVERATPPTGAGLEEAAGQLGRLTGVLSRYLAITGASSAERLWSRPRADMVDALNAAAVPLSRWMPPPSRKPEWSPNCAGMVSATADSLDAGYGLLLTHLEAGPDGLQTGRSWWGPAIRSPQVTAAIFDEITGLAQLAAVQARHLTSCGGNETGAALEAASSCLQRAADSGRSARWRTTGRTDQALLRAIPVRSLPLRPSLRDGENEAALCNGIVISAERLRQAAWRSAVGILPDGGGDALLYMATAARIACHLSEVVLRNTPDEHAGPLRVAAATAGRAASLWQHVSAAWAGFRTATLPETTTTMTDASDLIIRLGRLAYGDPRWTPTTGTGISPRHPDQARTVLAVLHHTADMLTRLSVGDLTAIASTISSGQFYALNRDERQSGRYIKIGGQDAEILHQAYLDAFDATNRLAGHLDQIALSRATPSIMLTKMRAAAPIPRDVIWHHHYTPAAPAPLGYFQAQMERLGIYDPVVLEHARQLDTVTEGKRHQIELESELRRRPAQRPGRHDTSRGS
jgi:hypothetical protein